MRCRCLNDLEYERTIHRLIGIEIGLIMDYGTYDPVEDQHECALQDWIAISAAPTFPPHEVIRSWLPRPLLIRIGQMFETLFYR